MADEANGVLEAGVNPAEQEGQKGPETVEQLKSMLALEQEKLAISEGRREESGKEAKRLAGRLEKLESSLSTPEKPGFALPDERTAIASLMNEYEFTEKQARAMFQSHSVLIQARMEQDIRLKALENQLKYGQVQNDKALEAVNPELRAANEMFENVPELANLPAAEKIERMRAMKTVVAKADTSQLKRAAGGITGGNAGRGAPVSAGDAADSAARSAGYINAVQQRELAAVNSDADYAAWSQRWKAKGWTFRK